MATVALLGALDTRSDEYAFIRDRVIEAGCDVLMINAGVLDDPDHPIAFSRADVASEAGSDIRGGIGHRSARGCRGPRRCRDGYCRRSRVEMDTDINDPAFAEAMAHRLDEHYRAWAADQLE